MENLEPKSMEGVEDLEVLERRANEALNAVFDLAKRYAPAAEVDRALEGARQPLRHTKPPCMLAPKESSVE